jgi:hypothetical protein
MTGTYSPSEPSEEARKLYHAHLAELEKRELTSTDNFDKSILTLSSAGLGISLSFIKDIIQQGPINNPWILYASWYAFLVTILCTMGSFMTSAKAMNENKSIAYRAYMLSDDAAFNLPNRWNGHTQKLNVMSALAFFVALVLTVVFVISNMKAHAMNTTSQTQKSAPELLQKGLTVPTMQRPTSAPQSGASTTQPAAQQQLPPQKG